MPVRAKYNVILQSDTNYGTAILELVNTPCSYLFIELLTLDSTVLILL